MRRPEFLPFSPPSIGPEEIEGVLDTLRSDWITTGPKVDRFERAFAEWVGAPEAVAVSSCTAGLHTGLAALGIGPGDAVVTTTLTFAGTVNAIEHVGARPLLVDVDPETLNLCPDRVAALLDAFDGPERVRALLPVHYAGHPCALDALYALAAERGLAVLEDAAHALPARAGSHLVGGANGQSVPWLVSFSFYATKNLTTGEGGMLTGTPELLARARVFSRHGLSADGWDRERSGAGWRYEVVEPGFKFNMTDIQAAIGLGQLGRLGAFHTRRREIAARYSLALADCSALELPVERPGYQHAWHLYALRLRRGRWSIARDRFVDELAAANIGASVHFVPVHRHRYYRERYGFTDDAFPNACAAADSVVSLPIYPRMDDRAVEDVIAAVRALAAEFAA